MDRLIERDFPLEAVSRTSAREKSIRQGHLSTLQMWWARRPLGVCRSSLFAALAPDPQRFKADDALMSLLNEAVPVEGASVEEKLERFTAELSRWETVKNQPLLNTAQRILQHCYGEPLHVVDTFAGGGSIPVEALRLGLRVSCSDLSPVATAALRTAISQLPTLGSHVVAIYRTAALRIAERIASLDSRLFRVGTDEQPLAFFWCRTFTCPSCRFEAPLLRDRWLARGRRLVAVKPVAEPNARRFRFGIYSPRSRRGVTEAGEGTFSGNSALCLNCRGVVKTAWLRQAGTNKKLGERLYARLCLTADGRRLYRPATHEDEELARSVRLRSLRGRQVARIGDEPLDLNGIRHTWAMQYGVRSVGDLYNRRQRVALLEVLHEIKREIANIDREHGRLVTETLASLLAFTFNRLVMYNSRHSWWQPNGEFPASTFTKQAIPMVWSYVEIPPSSPAAAGWLSAADWITKVANHLCRLPRGGEVWCGDAIRTTLPDGSVDLVAIDPPYFDSVVYSYLADVFYVWMRPILKEWFPTDFATPLTVKVEEAIVDRPHRLAPSPKRECHFARKLTDAFKEAHRMLRSDGRLLVMFGHKKARAWAVFLDALAKAGFAPVVSWPVQMERKVKFRHGNIDSLAASCIIVCRTLQSRNQRAISWAEFHRHLTTALAGQVQKFTAAHFFGTDLASALIAPAVSEFLKHDIVFDDGRSMQLEELLEELPSVAMRAQLDALLTSAYLQEYPNSASAIQRLAKEAMDSRQNGGGSWLELTVGDRLWPMTTHYAKLLHQNRKAEADRLWESASESERTALWGLLRAAAIVSPQQSNAQQLANAAVGRINLRRTQSA